MIQVVFVWIIGALFSLGFYGGLNFEAKQLRSCEFMKDTAYVEPTAGMYVFAAAAWPFALGGATAVSLVLALDRGDAVKRCEKKGA